VDALVNVSEISTFRIQLQAENRATNLDGEMDEVGEAESYQIVEHVVHLLRVGAVQDQEVAVPLAAVAGIVSEELLVVKDPDSVHVIAVVLLGGVISVDKYLQPQNFVFLENTRLEIASLHQQVDELLYLENRI
jgi:hypothetical protein